MTSLLSVLVYFKLKRNSPWARPGETHPPTIPRKQRGCRSVTISPRQLGRTASSSLFGVLYTKSQVFAACSCSCRRSLICVGRDHPDEAGERRDERVWSVIQP